VLSPLLIKDAKRPGKFPGNREKHPAYTQSRPGWNCPAYSTVDETCEGTRRHTADRYPAAEDPTKADQPDRTGNVAV
jgi:hypothetical protein